MSNWVVSQERVDKATKKVLGLRYRAFSMHHDSLPCRGLYVGLKEGSRGFAHYIFLRADLPIQRVSLTLWHELAHAQQCESFIRDEIPPKQATEEFKHYYDFFAADECEHRANVLAERLAPQHPLVIPIPFLTDS